MVLEAVLCVKRRCYADDKKKAWKRLENSIFLPTAQTLNASLPSFAMHCVGGECRVEGLGRWEKKDLTLEELATSRPFVVAEGR